MEKKTIVNIINMQNITHIFLFPILRYCVPEASDQILSLEADLTDFMKFPFFFFNSSLLLQRVLGILKERMNLCPKLLNIYVPDKVEISTPFLLAKWLFLFHSPKGT